MHHSLVTTAHPSMGKGIYGEGLDFDFLGFNARGQSGGQGHALCSALHNRKSPSDKDLNIKTPSFPLHCWDNNKLIACT